MTRRGDKSEDAEKEGNLACWWIRTRAADWSGEVMLHHPRTSAGVIEPKGDTGNIAIQSREQ